MNNYEIVFVFKDDEEAYKNGKAFVADELAKIGATITKDEDMGSRDLAYMVKKETRGHYHIYFFQADPEKISALDRSFRMNVEVLKYLIVNSDD